MVKPTMSDCMRCTWSNDHARGASFSFLMPDTPNERRDEDIDVRLLFLISSTTAAGSTGEGGGGREAGELRAPSSRVLGAPSLGEPHWGVMHSQCVPVLAPTPTRRPRLLLATKYLEMLRRCCASSCSTKSRRAARE